MAEVEIGKVQHFFDHVHVAALTIVEGELNVGDTIHIKGHTTDCTTTIESMQVEHEQIQSAKPGDNIGIRVPDKCREHDVVYKVTE